MINHPLTNVSFVVLGASFVGWLAAHLDRQIRRGSRREDLRNALRGGAYGIAATTLTIEACCVLAAVALAWHVSRSFGMSGFPGVFLLSFIDIQTYGMIFVLQSVPFSLVYGFAGGFWLARVHDGRGRS